MTENLGFHISAGLDVLAPKSGNAYPIPCDEWELLKSKLKNVITPPWFYQTAGSVLGGVWGSMVVVILSGTLPTTPQSNARVIAWATVIVSIICAGLCFLFAQKQRDLQAVYIGEVIKQMEIIEARYQSLDRPKPAQNLTIVSARYGIEGKIRGCDQPSRNARRTLTIADDCGQSSLPRPMSWKVQALDRGVSVRRAIAYQDCS